MGEGYVLALPVTDHVKFKQFSRIKRQDFNLKFQQFPKINREDFVLALPAIHQVKTQNCASEAENSNGVQQHTHDDDDIDMCVGDSDPVVVQEDNDNSNGSRNNPDDDEDLFVSGIDNDEVNSSDITSESSEHSCTESGFCTAYPPRDSPDEHEHSDSTESRKTRLRVRKRSEECSSNDGICTDDDNDERRPVKRRALPTRGAGKTVSPRSSSLVAQMKMKGSSNDNNNKKRNDSLHKLLFLPDGLPVGAYLAYKVKGQTILEGYKTANGIFCNHCSNVVSPSQFEAHAGMASRKKPYQHIYTAEGITLHDIALTLANGQNHQTASMNDEDITSDCVASSRKPRMKIVRTRSRRAADQKKSETDYAGSCALCSGHDFSVNKFDDRTVIICDQCEKEFHVGCLREDGRCDLKGLPTEKWFCCCDCERIFTSLRDLVSRRSADVIPSSESRMINKKLKEEGLHQVGDNDIRVRLLQGKRCPLELRPLLSKAIFIFREGFGSITAASGRDLIPPMVRGKNYFGQEYGGMYCAVLTVRSVVVSVALIRILGREVAEVPLVATRTKFRGKGLFQALFSQIEKLIGLLKVENLVLPATEDAKNMWIDKFGLREISQEKLSRYTTVFPLSVFEGTVMLEKQVVEQQH